jgi:hypothetical protein
MLQFLQLNQWAGVLEVHINIRKHQGHLEVQDLMASDIKMFSKKGMLI